MAVLPWEGWVGGRTGNLSPRGCRIGIIPNPVEVISSWRPEAQRTPLLFPTCKLFLKLLWTCGAYGLCTCFWQRAVRINKDLWRLAVSRPATFCKILFSPLKAKKKSVFEIVQRPRIWAEACVDLTVWEDDWRGSWNIQLGNFICTCSLVLPIHTSPCWHTLIYLLPWAKDIVLFWERFSKGTAVSPWDDGSWLKDSFVHLVMHKASSVSS